MSPGTADVESGSSSASGQYIRDDQGMRRIRRQENEKEIEGVVYRKEGFACRMERNGISGACFEEESCISSDDVRRRSIDD